MSIDTRERTESGLVASHVIQALIAAFQIGRRHAVRPDPRARSAYRLR